MSDLEAQINQVRKLRSIVADQKAAIDSRMVAWKADNELLLSAYEADHRFMLDAEDLLRKLTLEAYQADPSNKKPALGVGIRIVKQVNFDPKEALKWAMRKEACIMLDETAFEKAVIAGIFQDIPATVTEEVQATISKDLGGE
jgi:hypothetical protein